MSDSTNKVPTLDEADADWLTHCLQKSYGPATRITGVETEWFGTGQVGKCVRFKLQIEGNGEAVPETLVGKFPADDAESRRTGVDMKIYWQEVAFYRHIAPRLSISVPHCFFAEIEGYGPDFLILLEDMHPAVQGDNIEGCSPEVARRAILELVGLHAPTWCDQSVSKWLINLTDTPFGDMRGLYNEALPIFIDRYRDRLPRDELDIIQAVGEAEHCTLYDPYPADLFSLVHYDYRLDNLLIDTSPRPFKLTVVDWQSVRLHNPLSDVAYLLGNSLVPETRRRVEERIVEEYFNALTAAGVDGLSSARCWQEYRKSAVVGFGIPVVASMALGRTERGDRMLLTMARRHARHALDIGAAEFLR